MRVFQTLREKLRCKEIWVVGAERWRDPDDDLPKDYEGRRVENYAKLRKPLDPQGFVDDMREELDHELSQLNDALGGQGLRWLKLSERKTGAIQLTPLEAAPEPIRTALSGTRDTGEPSGEFSYPLLGPALTRPTPRCSRAAVRRGRSSSLDICETGVCSGRPSRG